MNDELAMPLDFADSGICSVAMRNDPAGVDVSPEVPQAVQDAAAYLADAGYRVDMADPPAVAGSAKAWKDFAQGETLLCQVNVEQAMPYGVDLEDDASVARLYRSHVILFATAYLGLPCAGPFSGSAANGTPSMACSAVVSTPSTQSISRSPCAEHSNVATSV